MIVNGIILLANLGILALNLKLYTEFAKQRMQESRQLEAERQGKGERDV